MWVRRSARPTACEQLGGAFARGGAGHAIEDERDFDVFERVEVGDEVAAGLLPDEADLLAAVLDHLGFGDGDEVLPADEGAAGGGLIEAGEDVEERALAGAGGADDGHEFATADLEVQATERHDFEISDLVDLEEVFAEDVGLFLDIYDALRCVRLGHRGR